MRNTENRVVNGTSYVLISLAAIFFPSWSASRSTPDVQAAQQAPTRNETKAVHDHSSENKPTRSPLVSPKPIPDVEVLDQEAKPLHFYSDLIKGRKVIVNFIFTSCNYVCPLQGANFAKLQAALGDWSRKDVSLVSVSIDPSIDTPERLKAWRKRFGGKEGWTLVTGRKAEMDRLLLAMTGDPSGVKDHAGIAFIGNYDRGVWIRADSLDDPARLIKTLDNALGRQSDQ